MRKPLLFGVIAIAIVLALGAANALAIDPDDQATFVALNRQAQAAATGAGSIAGRSAFRSDNSAKAVWIRDGAESSSPAWPRWSGH